MIRRTNLGLSIASLLVTVWSLWHVGVFMAAVGGGPSWVYPASVLAFLVAHEGGHAGMAALAGLRPGWPLCLPWPLPLAAWVGSPWLPAFGTLGAWVPLPGLRRLSARARWQVAVAGPVAGLCVAVGLLWLGVAASHPAAAGHVWSRLPVPWLVRWLVPAGLAWHPAIVAGWLGVLVTGLNLLPLPGLDGWALWASWGELSVSQRLGSLALGGIACACLHSS